MLRCYHINWKFFLRPHSTLFSQIKKAATQKMNNPDNRIIKSYFFMKFYYFYQHLSVCAILLYFFVMPDESLYVKAQFRNFYMLTSIDHKMIHEKKS